MLQSKKCMRLSGLTFAFVTGMATPLAVTAAADARSFRAEAMFRLDNPCPRTGQIQGACTGYVIDRIIPPICGGAEDPSNMQWQTIAEAKEKARWERIGCRAGRKLVLPQTSTVITEAFPLQEVETRTEVQPLPLQ